MLQKLNPVRYLRSAWAERLKWVVAPVPSDILAELELLQFERLLALIPLLYISIAMITLASAVATRDELPLAYQWVLPGFLLVASVVRLLVWTRRRKHDITTDDAHKHLQNTFWIAVGLSAFAGCWSLFAYFESSESGRMLAAVFIAFAGLASANCLASLPRAAIATIVLSLGPIAGSMLFSSNLGEKAMGISIFVVAMLQLRLVISQFQAMTKALHLQRDMRNLADTDPLTGLKNRRALDRTMQQYTAHGSDFAIALLDLDGFKAVNDQNGHGVGDLLLKQVAERLVSHAGPQDMISRLGGDEFALLMPGSRSDTVLNDHMASLSNLLALPYLCDENWLNVTASVGAARYGKDGVSSGELLKVADRAVYKTKSETKRRRFPERRKSQQAAA